MMIMFDLISPDASGCLAIASIFPPINPIPIPAPITANPAPSAANVPSHDIIWFILKIISLLMMSFLYMMMILNGCPNI